MTSLTSCRTCSPPPFFFLNESVYVSKIPPEVFGGGRKKPQNQSEAENFDKTPQTASEENNQSFSQENTDYTGLGSVSRRRLGVSR